MIEAIVPGGVIVAFAWMSLLVELTPGPNMTYLALLSATRGRQAGFAAVVGIALGLGVMGVAAAVGLGSVMAQSRLLYETIRWAGVAYLLWLAVEAWQSASEDIAAVEPGGLHLPSFRDGLVTNLLNPKAAVFYIGVLPAFTDPTRAYMPQAALLVLIYVAVATLVHGAIVVLASQAQHLLTDVRRRTLVGRSLALALVLVAGWVAWVTRAQA